MTTSSTLNVLPSIRANNGAYLANVYTISANNGAYAVSACYCRETSSAVAVRKPLPLANGELNPIGFKTLINQSFAVSTFNLENFDNQSFQPTLGTVMKAIDQKELNNNDQTSFDYVETWSSQLATSTVDNVLVWSDALKAMSTIEDALRLCNAVLVKLFEPAGDTEPRVVRDSWEGDRALKLVYDNIKNTLRNVSLPYIPDGMTLGLGTGKMKGVFIVKKAQKRALKELADAAASEAKGIIKEVQNESATLEGETEHETLLSQVERLTGCLNSETQAHEGTKRELAALQAVNARQKESIKFLESELNAHKKISQGFETRAYRAEIALEKSKTLVDELNKRLAAYEAIQQNAISRAKAKKA